MSIGFYTDNSVSQAVMRAFSFSGMKTAHINTFDPFNPEGSIFYGILRGTGSAMRYLQFMGTDYHYLDNGYFDAQYIDKKKNKDLSGTFRVVKNDMIEPMDIMPCKTTAGPMNILMIPPTPYSAFMYDTTPEDWLKQTNSVCTENGHTAYIKEKSPGVILSDDFAGYDAIYAFNSMAVMGAIEKGLAVYTTHGIIRNSHLIEECAPYYDIEELRKFYSSKHFTLEQISDLGVKCLM